MVMFGFRIILFCLCAIIILPGNNAARVLAYFPMPSISHQVVFRPLTQELVKRGHEVTVITADPAFTKETRPRNLTEIDLHDISYDLWSKRFIASSIKNQDSLAHMRVLATSIKEVLELQFNTKEFQDILKRDRKYFDLIIVEAVAATPLILSHIFDAPLIQMSSFGAFYGHYETMGATSHPLLSPTMLRRKLTDLSMWDKLKELSMYYIFVYLFNTYKTEENELIKKLFGSNAPTVNELSNNVDMMFLNIHPIWGGNVAVPPSLIHMGGLHQKPLKELPQDLKSFLDSSTNGVIYLSFGTNVDPALLPPEKIQMFVNVLSKLPYNVLWKWNNDALPGKSDNIRFGKWFPQSDLLRHTNVKLFITQGGLQSTDEALTAGVPLVGIPMLVDQWYNVERYVQHKIGVRLDLDSISEKKFRDAVTTVIEDESYRRNVVRLGTLMRDEPQTPLDRAVWWAEHVIRHRGAKHLRSPAANISWAQYLELEIVGILLGVLALVLSVIFVIVYYVWSFVKQQLSYKKKVKSS